ncbi:MAG: hypothetical protein HRU40_09260 [Saprospiraceae bacterium]|nr:hypothetical protein [Saprospiraceae bacterium]
MKITFGLLLLTLLIFPAQSQKLMTKSQVDDSKEAGVTPIFGSFTIDIEAHEENTLFFDYIRGDKQDKHLDAKLSLRYPFTHKRFNNGDLLGVYFSFTQEFDFYAGTRDSGPVVSRRFNPSYLQVMYGFKDKKDGLIELRFSWEHESNGQSVDDINTLLAQRNENYNKYKDEKDFTEEDAFKMATEELSRGYDFISLGFYYRHIFGDALAECSTIIECINFEAKFRQHTTNIEDEIFWMTNNTSALNHFQGSKITASTQWQDNSENKENRKFSISYRTGELFSNKAGKNNTIDLTYTHEVVIDETAIPLSLSYHNGYLEELYKYQEKSVYWSLGFNLVF